MPYSGIALQCMRGIHGLAPCKELDQCKAQAHALSGLIQRNWLGPFDQLCLSCGVIAFAEDDGQVDAVETDTPPQA